MDDLSPKEIKDTLLNSADLSPKEIEELLLLQRKHKQSTGLSKKEIIAMLGKSGKDRYIYSVKRIAEQEVAWTLKDDEGIIATVDDDGNSYFHIWPYKEYALKCATDEWKGFTLFKLTLKDLLEVILPNLTSDGTRVAVFKSPCDPQTISASANDLLNNLLYECSQFT